MTLTPATFTFINTPTNVPNVETGSSIIHKDSRVYPIVLEILLSLVFCIAMLQIFLYMGILCIQFWGHVKEQNKKYFKVSLNVLLIPLVSVFLSRLVLVCWSLDFLPKVWIPYDFYELCTYWSLWILLGFYFLSQWTAFYFSMFAPSMDKRQMKEYEEHFNDYLDVFIVIPVCRESSTHLMWTLESLVESDYPKSKLRIVMAFDEDSDGLEYILFLKQLNLLNGIQKDKYAETMYKGVKLFLCKWYHSGKRSSQRFAIEVIRRKYGQDPSIKYDPVILFCDSDVMLEKFSIHNAICTFAKNPKLVAISGETVVDQLGRGVYHLFDAMSLWDKLLFTRPNQECFQLSRNLSGHLFFIRFLAFRDVELRYFADCEAQVWPSKYHRLNFGDHTFLQSLVLEHYGPIRLQYCPTVTAYTRSLHTLSGYMYQKRRQFLGDTSNAMANAGSSMMLSKSWLLYTCWIWDLVKHQTWIPMVLLLTSCAFSPFSVLPQISILSLLLCIRWTLFSVSVKQFIPILFYPFYFLLIQPFVELSILILSVFTWNDVYWGLPRDLESFLSTKDTSLYSKSISSAFSSFKKIQDDMDFTDDITKNAVKNILVESTLVSQWPSNVEKTRYEKFGLMKKSPKRVTLTEESNVLELDFLTEPVGVATKERSLIDINRSTPQPFQQE